MFGRMDHPVCAGDGDADRSSRRAGDGEYLPASGSVGQDGDTLDIISQGRLILGLGAGWFELEHTTYGIPFPRVSERLQRLDEALTVITRLWTEERVTFAGRYYQLNDALLNPRPLQQPCPPLLIGASGEKIALDIVARHADMWNLFGSPAVFQRKIAVLTEHCHKVGRDPDAIE